MSYITTVFCMVEGGKKYAERNRRDARVMVLELLAIMHSCLRQVSSGYFVKELDGDVKFMLAFSNPEVGGYHTTL